MEPLVAILIVARRADVCMLFACLPPLWPVPTNQVHSYLEWACSVPIQKSPSTGWLAIYRCIVCFAVAGSGKNTEDEKLHRFCLDTCSSFWPSPLRWPMVL